YYWSGDSKLLLTSDIGMVVKKSEHDLLVWLNSLSSNTAVAGATVKVFSKANQQLMEGTSDSSGFVHFEDVNWSGDRKPFVITASKDGDQSFIELDKCTLTETDLKTEGRPYISSGYEGFLYTDRGVFRPGETVHMRAILRGRDQDTPESFPVVFEVNRPDGRQFAGINGLLSGFGTVDIDIDIPNYALTGGYTANLMLPGSKEIIGSAGFSVEEFMPDRLKVLVTMPDGRLVPGKAIPIDVKAEQFFGAPADGRNIEVVYDLRQQEFKPDGYKDYTFTDNTRDFLFQAVSLGEKTSGTDGAAGFELKLPENLSPPSALRCEISAVVKEIGGRAVTARTERMVDAYPYYIGIRQARAGYAVPGRGVKFEYAVFSPDGEKIDAPELEVTISKVIWNNTLKKDDKGEYRYVSDSREEVIHTDTLTQGGSSYSYTPKSWGDYVIRVKGKNAASHAASLAFYCSDSGYMPWAMERPDRIELKLDKASYAAGDTAKLTIKSPFKGKALVTISKDKVLSSRIVDLANPTQEVLLTIEDGWRPNAYCAVTIIRPVDPNEDWVAYRAYGIIPVIIDNSAHKLSVDVSSPVSSAPKDTVQVDIEVTDAGGNPRQAELSLALVDEGVLSLTNFKTPDPFEFFYGKRGNSIVTSDIYSLLIPEFGNKQAGADSSPSGDQAPYDPKKRLTL
ncbi:MAG: MG2 domain-containing protein, partial [Candidatus Omnitrophota bacterium]